MWKEGWSDVGCCWELGDNFSAMTVIGEGSRVWKHHWAPGRSHSGSPNVKQQKNVLAPWASSCGKAGPPVIIARGPQRPRSEGRVSGNSRLQNYRSSARGKPAPNALTASQGHLFSDQSQFSFVLLSPGSRPFFLPRLYPCPSFYSNLHYYLNPM